MTNLVYRTGHFYNHTASRVYHRQDPVEPQIGDKVAVGRYYAMMVGGVTLDSHGVIIALREPRG